MTGMFKLPQQIDLGMVGAADCGSSCGVQYLALRRGKWVESDRGVSTGWRIEVWCHHLSESESNMGFKSRS